MFKGIPEVGDVFYDSEGDSLLILEVNKEASVADEQVYMLRLNDGLQDDKWYDSLENFKSGNYLAKVA